MRWMYAPQQRRYLYLAMFCYGWMCDHPPDLAVERAGRGSPHCAGVAALGRDLFVTNSVIYLVIYVS